MNIHFDPNEGMAQFEFLPKYADQRETELSEMFEPYLQVTSAYGQMICRLVCLLGEISPESTQDKVMRDLGTDVFDFLYESERIIMQGKLAVSYPLLRRAYESLSLLALCSLESKYAKKWTQGKKIGNAEVRKQLAKHPMGESENNTREFYSFFSQASHPNRSLIGQKLLGEGNKFVLGSIAVPHLPLVVDYCINHLNLWFWFGAMFSFHYREVIKQFDPSYFDVYSKAAGQAQEVAVWLKEQLENVEKEYSELMEYEFGRNTQTQDSQ